MFLSVFLLITSFVTPRVIQGSREVRASQAVALQLELDKIQERWKAAGGLRGNGEGDNTGLTRNLICCFASPAHIHYMSGAPDLMGVGGSWVYEKSSRCIDPSDVRLSGFSTTGLKSAILVLPDGRTRAGVLLDNTFVVLFDGLHWLVSPEQ